MTEDQGQGVVTLPAADLLGMITDIERTASRDRCLPMLRGILLHTDGTNPGGRLYATSINRAVLGQAWETCEGTLAPTFLDPEALALLRVLLAQAQNGERADLIAIGELDRLRVNVPDIGSVIVMTQNVRFPDIGRLVGQQTNGSDAALSATLITALAQVGKRRGASLLFKLGEPLRAATIDIGPRYRALLMPVKEADPESYVFSVPERSAP